MTRLSPNLFPENLRDTIAATFKRQDPQMVLINISPRPTDAENCLQDFPPERLLHPQELAMSACYTLAKRRSEFLAGRYCAKKAIIDYLQEIRTEQPDLPMNAIEIRAGRSDRPIALLHGLSNVPAVDISITHSGHHAAAMAMEGVCGIDLQRPSVALLRVQTRYCQENEKQLLHEALPHADLLERLTILWATKEAAMKALSYRKMPGFLDLETIGIAQGRRKCLTFMLAVTSKRPARLPEEITVAVTTFGNYGLAVCIIDKGEFNA